LCTDVVHGSDETAKAEAAAEAYVEVSFFLLSYWQLDTDVVFNTHSGSNRAELEAAKARARGRATATPVRSS
tara:strand:+ start:51 stop:266 length:216 start_codon:yes stop_codon:yes gene_type:complete